MTRFAKRAQHALDAVFHELHVKVQQEPLPDLKQPQICEQLRLVHGQKSIDGLELQNERALDDEVNPVSVAERDSLVVDRKAALADEGQAAQLQLMPQAPVVRGLEQSWTQRGVDFDRRSNHGLCKLASLDFHGPDHLQTKNQN